MSTPDSQQFIFDHVQKTGGTTLRAVFEQLFGSTAVSPTVVGRPLGWALENYSHCRVVCGHFGPVPTNQFSDRHRVTLLRHPANRVFSYYNYLRHGVGEAEGGPPAVAAKAYGIDDFLRFCGDTPDTHISNFVTRHFAMWQSRDIADDARCLAMAKRTLSEFQFVGLTERLQETIDLFCFAYAQSVIPDAPRLNVDTAGGRFEKLDHLTRDRLLELNQLDLALYESAARQFAERQRETLRECISLRSRGPAKARTAPINPHSPALSIEGPPTAKERLCENFGDREVEIRHVGLTGIKSGSDAVDGGEEVVLKIRVSAHVDVPNLTVGIEIRDPSGATAFGTNTHLLGIGVVVEAGHEYAVCYCFQANLEVGLYQVGVALHTGAEHTERCFHWWDGAGNFRVVGHGGAPFVGHTRLGVSVLWRPVTSPSVGLLGWMKRLWTPYVQLLMKKNSGVG